MISVINRCMTTTHYNLIRITRTYGFLIMLGIVITLGYFLVPPADAGYQTMYVGEARSIYNSAWIGAVAALSSSLFLWPFGFYLLRGKISEDRERGVGSILASSPMNNFHYLLSKMISNFLTLAVMAGVLELAFIAMQYIRWEETQFVLSDYLLPYVWIVLPSLCVLATLTILFDIIPFMKGVIGNIVFFSMWTAISALSFSGVGTIDIFGSQFIFIEILNGVQQEFPTLSATNMNFGYQTAQSLLIFDWTGITWTKDHVTARLFWLLIGTFLFLISVLIFQRDSLLPLENRISARKTNAGLAQDRIRHQPEGIEAIHLQPVEGVRKYSFYYIVRSELRLMFRDVPIWWYGVGMILLLLTMFVPLSSTKIFLYFIWLWLIPLLAPIGAKEKMYRTEQLLFSNVPPYMQLFAVWLSGVFISFLITSGGTVQMIVGGDWGWLSAWITAVLFSPTLALAAGIWAGTRKLYEAIFVVWWIMGPVQNAPYLDFTGIQGNHLTYAYLLLTAGLAIAAMIGRKRQIHR
ncbi:hypothetical protein [Pseudogracilibacillus sp. SO30301A]|uniref:hypothetical protein n=1 Tax=Pseudogracilibacillus sp. SO30301A TaxID=3098291 RepID=UPI00300E02DA